MNTSKQRISVGDKVKVKGIEDIEFIVNKISIAYSPRTNNITNCNCEWYEYDENELSLRRFTRWFDEYLLEKVL